MKTGAFVHVHVKVYLCYFTRNVTFINSVLIFVITKKIIKKNINQKIFKIIKKINKCQNQLVSKSQIPWNE